MNYRRFITLLSVPLHFSFPRVFFFFFIFHPLSCILYFPFYFFLLPSYVHFLNCKSHRRTRTECVKIISKLPGFRSERKWNTICLSTFSATPPAPPTSRVFTIFEDFYLEFSHFSANSAPFLPRGKFVFFLKKCCRILTAAKFIGRANFEDRIYFLIILSGKKRWRNSTIFSSITKNTQ